MSTHSPLRTLAAAAAVVFLSAGIAAGQPAVLDLGSIPLRPAGPPVDFGTTRDAYYSAGGWEFSPVSSTMTYSDFLLLKGSLNALRFGTTPYGGFMAGVHLPDGAVLTGIEWNLCDSSLGGDHVNFGLLSARNSDGFFEAVGTTASTTSNTVTPCQPYFQDLTSANYVVDSLRARLVLFMVMSAGDDTNAVAGARIAYRLQVSPAPATPTFGDVPASHGFYQFIEALARAGITGGCGGGNYCPDNPVTRGQMAVFLAKALGLQFPVVP